MLWVLVYRGWDGAGFRWLQGGGSLPGRGGEGDGPCKRSEPPRSAGSDPSTASSVSDGTALRKKGAAVLPSHHSVH